MTTTPIQSPTLTGRIPSMVKQTNRVTFKHFSNENYKEQIDMITKMIDNMAEQKKQIKKQYFTSLVTENLRYKEI